jgi:WD40 repeat protein
LSPNCELIAFTTEDSSIYLYRLYENKLDGRRNRSKSEETFESKVKQTKRIDTKLNEKSFFQELIGGHSGPVFRSKFTHDSKYLISCGSDGRACLWDINKSSAQMTRTNVNMRKLLELNKPKESSENSKSVKADDEEEDDECNDRMMRDDEFEAIFSRPAAETASLVCAYSGHVYPVWDVETFSYLNLFATCSKDTTARLWSFDRMYPLRVYCGHQADVNCVQFHPNGAYLATGSNDKTVRLWSVQSAEFLRLFSGHRSRVYSVAFSPNGCYLASAGEDKKIKIWDLRMGSVYKEFKGHDDIIHSVVFDSNSEILCSGGLDKTVKFWDIHDKGINIGAELVRQINPLANSPTCNNANSSELIRSINVDFNVYSSYFDIQNVAYFSGAKKPARPEKFHQSKFSPSEANELLRSRSVEPKPTTSRATSTKSRSVNKRNSKIS